MNKQYILNQLADTEEHASQLANYCQKNKQSAHIFFFSGPLGAGKTTFIQYFLRALGITGPIKSPSFALLHTYETAHFCVLHADCYRIQHPHEWENLGIDHYQSHNKPLIFCIEWPEHIALHKPDAHFTLDYGKTAEERSLSVTADDTFWQASTQLMA